MHAPNRIAPLPEAAKTAELPSEIALISAELFPGPFEVRYEVDPEMPNERFLVLTVHAEGNSEEVVDRRREWHRRVARVLPDSDIRLTITSL